MDVRTRLEHALGAAYSLDRELSGGGMSHVYIAEERAFGRQVVVKVLREDLTEGASAERFKREISLLSKLQHPHIVPLLSAGEDAGTLYYTMPFVEGESLRDRLRREGELPVQDVVRVMREVASALDYAHRRGIIHRDIKPENILFSDGNAVVTDFGIAKALEVARTQGDARASTISQFGVALGTPAYMAPEQGAADPTLDHRADLYALGCVGYELLTGRPPFEGRTARQLVAAHATEEPRAVGALRANASSGLATLVMQCLEKRPADRPQSAADVLRSLDGLAISPSGRAPTAETTSGRREARLSARKVLVTFSLLGAGLAAGVLFARWLSRPGASLATYDVGLSDDAPIVFRGHLSLSIAPHGDFAIYVAETSSGVAQLRYRSLVDSVERVIPGTDAGFAPQVSPDGIHVAFIRQVPSADGRARPRLEITDVNGGQPRTLADLRAPVAIRWVSASRFLVVDDDGTMLRWFEPQTGELGSGKPIQACRSPSPLGDGESLLCGGAGVKFGTVSRAGGGPELILRQRGLDESSRMGHVFGSHFRVVDDRYIVFLSIDGELRAARFDRSTLEVGRPVTLVAGVRRDSYQNVGQYDISSSGMLIYARGDNAEVGQMMIVRPRSANPQPSPLLAEPAAFQRFDLSPDGQRLAAVVQGLAGQQLRVYEVADGRSRIWLMAPFIGMPLWSPRGNRLMVNVIDDSISNLLVGSPDAAVAPDTLSRASAERPVPTPMSWRSDSLVVAIQFNEGTLMKLDPRLHPPKLESVMRSVGFADISPDGRLLLFGRRSLDISEITPFRTRSTMSQLSDASEAVWISMTTVRYRGPQGSWYEVTVDSATGRVRGAPRLYFVDPRFADTPGWSHRAVSADGMIYVQGPAKTSASYLRVVPNWVEKMKHSVDSAAVLRN